MKKVGHILKNIFFFILRFFINLLTNKKNTVKNRNNNSNIENNNEKKVNDSLNNTSSSDNDSSDSPRELFKEHINKLKKFIITDEKLEEEFNKVIEKKFKIKIKELQKEDKERLKEYTKKTITKIKDEITKEKIENIEDLKVSFEDQLKKDLIEKERRENDLLKDNIEKSENVINNNEIFFTQFQQKGHPIINNKIQKTITTYKVPKINLKSHPTIEQPKTILFQDINHNVLENKDDIIDTNNSDIEQISDFSEIKSNNQDDVISSLETGDLNEEKEDKLTEIKIEEAIESTNEINISNILPDVKPIEKSKVLEEKPVIQKKAQLEQKLETVKPEINFELIYNQNNKIIESSKLEINKDEFIDKQYDIIEKLINDKINELEYLLSKPLEKEQKSKLKKELNKLNILKQQISLHKEKDLEEIRRSLEENIPYEELVDVTKKLKLFHDDTEMKEKEIYFQTIENKSRDEIESLKKKMLIKALKKTIKPLDLPFLVGIPFMKNRFFRNLVSGLFLFRSFQFMKNILFESFGEENDIDLTNLQNGKDALIESIKITEKNIMYFDNLKNSILLKYPELREDEEFLKYVNKLEQDLQNNYERLLKHDKIVNKYFNISKKLVRKKSD